MALRVRYEGSCLTGFFKWCVGGVNGKLEKRFSFAGGLLGNELTSLVESLNEVLFIAISVVVSLRGLSIVIKWSIGSYSCRLYRICWAYADCGLLFLIYRICSWKRRFWFG